MVRRELRPGSLPPLPLDGEDAGTRLQALVDGLARRRRIPHAVVGVARGDLASRWVGAAGPAGPGREPMTAETPFFVASVTKLVIATVVLQLHERGDLDLDSALREHLPGDLIAGLHRLDGIDHTDRITLRHLLSHTSGLPDHLEDHARGDRSLYRRLVAGEDLSWTLDDVVEAARRIGPRFAPGDLGTPTQRARYSDTGFQLLLAVVEAVTGRSAPSVFEEQLLRPLDLRHTYVPGRSRPLAPLPVEPAAVWSGARTLDIPQAMASANDLVSTADDTLRFLSALTRGEVFADPRTYDLMQERWNRIFHPMRYGLGLMLFRVPWVVGPQRRSVTFVGHSGSTGSWLLHCPELDLLLTGTVDEVHARAVPFRFLPKVLRTLTRTAR